jgi:hypothetical protein
MNAPNTPPPEILAMHSALVSKRAILNQLLWQAPALCFTAQAFLLTIAFDTTKLWYYRDCSGFMAAIIGFLSWQTFCRHSAFEIETSIDLEELENKYFRKTVHARKSLDGDKYSCITRLIPSRILWKGGLFILSWVGVLPILGQAAKASGWFDSP